MSQLAGSLTGTMKLLRDKGVRFGTVIDVGASEGYFYLLHAYFGFFPGAVPLNVDANALYVPQLQAIKEVAGGEYRITAIADYTGEIEITQGTHAVWNSVRPSTDPYWQRLNQEHRTSVKVPVTTIDALVADLKLPGPYLLKLDIQGAELAALRGAREMLKNTDVVICEADLDDFQALNKAIAEAGFDLFDLTDISRLADASLGWCYPTYLNKRLDHIRTRAIWDAQRTDEVVRFQEERRNKILAHTQDMLAQIRGARTKGA